jgi:hypothetical protein
MVMNLRVSQKLRNYLIAERLTASQKVPWTGPVRTWYIYKHLPTKDMSPVQLPAGTQSPGRVTHASQLGDGVKHKAAPDPQDGG